MGLGYTITGSISRGSTLTSNHDVSGKTSGLFISKKINGHCVRDED